MMPRLEPFEASPPRSRGRTATRLAPRGHSANDYAALCEHLTESERVKPSRLIVVIINDWTCIAVGFRLVHPTPFNRAAA